MHGPEGPGALALGQGEAGEQLQQARDGVAPVVGGGGVGVLTGAVDAHGVPLGGDGEGGVGGSGHRSGRLLHLGGGETGDHALSLGGHHVGAEAALQAGHPGQSGLRSPALAEGSRYDV